jgi:hypothetical protein
LIRWFTDLLASLHNRFRHSSSVISRPEVTVGCPLDKFEFGGLLILNDNNNSNPDPANSQPFSKTPQDTYPSCSQIAQIQRILQFDSHQSQR